MMPDLDAAARWLSDMTMREGDGGLNGTELVGACAGVRLAHRARPSACTTEALDRVWNRLRAGGREVAACIATSEFAEVLTPDVPRTPAAAASPSRGEELYARAVAQLRTYSGYAQAARTVREAAFAGIDPMLAGDVLDLFARRQRACGAFGHLPLESPQVPQAWRLLHLPLTVHYLWAIEALLNANAFTENPKETYLV